jgi:hypothetical protein
VSSIFVFYDCQELSNDQQKEWQSLSKESSKNMPKNWNYLGRGGAPGWCREHQYMGPYETRHGAKRVLERLFRTLLQKGIITRFKIRFSYKP